MSKPTVLLTGAGGEMGHLLVPALADRGFDVVALDLVKLPASVESRCFRAVEASILDTAVLNELLIENRPEWIFHLAAILSTKVPVAFEAAMKRDTSLVSKRTIG